MIRIGAVGYLNARPLWHALRGAPDVDLRTDVPAECARLLHAGTIDLGLVPVVELLRGPVTYDIVPGLAIGCLGPVLSVSLFTRRPLSAVRSIALDTSSRSSVGLVRVLCRHHFGLTPTLVDAPPDLPAMLEIADAALLIGDPALDAPILYPDVQVIDLGEAWQAFTGLPFVFAAWIARPGAVTPDLVARLHEARRAGAAAIPTIAQDASDSPARADALERYLRHNIRYDLDAPALSGLSRYLTLVMQDGLAPERPDVQRAVERLREMTAVES